MDKVPDNPKKTANELLVSPEKNTSREESNVGKGVDSQDAKKPGTALSEFIDSEQEEKEEEEVKKERQQSVLSIKDDGVDEQFFRR